jgi:hypothetical protein
MIAPPPSARTAGGEKSPPISPPPAVKSGRAATPPLTPVADLPRDVFDDLAALARLRHYRGDDPQAIVDAVFAAAWDRGHALAGAAALVRQAVPLLAWWDPLADWQRLRRTPDEGEPTACDPELCGIMDRPDGDTRCDYCRAYGPPLPAARSPEDVCLQNRREKRSRWRRRVAAVAGNVTRAVLENELPEAVGVLLAHTRGGAKWDAA